METKILKPNKENIELAASLLKNGELVAVPTETVYGLAGSAKLNDTVKNIFIAKGRPQDNPLIVHISNREMLNGIVQSPSQDAILLMDAF